MDWKISSKRIGISCRKLMWLLQKPVLKPWTESWFQNGQQLFLQRTATLLKLLGCYLSLFRHNLCLEMLLSRASKNCCMKLQNLQKNLEALKEYWLQKRTSKWPESWIQNDLVWKNENPRMFNNFEMIWLCFHSTFGHFLYGNMRNWKGCCCYSIKAVYGH